MKGAFVSRDIHLWKKLYTTYIRPQLEFAVPVWNPFSECDIKLLEQVQRRATKVSHALRGQSYSDRLSHLGLTTLRARRTRGDCLQKFRIEKGLERVRWHTGNNNMTRRGGVTTRTATRMRSELVRNCDPRYHFFNNRLVKPWNKLPDQVVEATSVNSFKNNYDKFQMV